MSEKSSESSLRDLASGTFQIPGFSSELMDAKDGLNQMGSYCSKILEESSSAKSSSPTQPKATINVKISIDLSSNTYSAEALAAYAASKSLAGMTARLHSQLSRGLNEASYQRLHKLLQSTPSSIEID